MKINLKKIKENLKAFYNSEAEFRNLGEKKTDWKIKIREEFLNLILKENKKTFLEIGAGVGYDSLYFKEKGLDVIAVDISKIMVEKCRDKGLDAYELDFYNLKSLNKTFDCVYSMNSILHVPKNDLANVLRRNEKSLFYSVILKKI